MQLPRLLLAATLLIGVFKAQAAPITFFGEDLNGDPFSRIAFPNALAARSSFLGQLPASSTDNLEGLTPGTLTPIALTFSGIFSATLTGGNSAVRSLTSGTDNFGEYPTSGNKYIATDSNAAVTITFSSAITSFGFYGTDIGDFGNTRLNLVFSSATGSFTQPVNNTLGAGRNSSADGSVLFFGYINTANPFTSVQITSTSDSFGFDDPVIGVARLASTPEPGTLLLLGSAFLFVCPKALRILNSRA